MCPAFFLIYLVDTQKLLNIWIRIDRNEDGTLHYVFMTTQLYFGFARLRVPNTRSLANSMVRRYTEFGHATLT